jgi:CheY-like chemotaxis protein
VIHRCRCSVSLAIPVCPVKVLVAFTNERWVEVLREFLRERDCEVETVAQGVDCLPKLRQFLPDVLVLDRDLPWGGGDGVLACMRDDAHTATIPVVVMDGAGQAPLAVEPPVVDCVRRPVHLDALLAAIFSAIADRPASVSKPLGRLEPANRCERARHTNGQSEHREDKSCSY